MKRDLIELDIDSVVVKSRVRRDDGDLSTLESSIQKLGLLHPIIVDRRNILIAGGRRLEACRQSGVSKVPALRVDADFDSVTAVEIQSDENLCRVPLSADEVERLIQRKRAFVAGGVPGRRARILDAIFNLFRRK